MIGRCEYAAAFLLALLVLAGCGESNSEPSDGALIVKERLRGTTLFFEGSRSFATLEAASDGEPIQRELAGYEPGNRTLVRGLKPGEYRLSSWVRPCGGNCGVLGPPQDRCATGLKIRGDERLVAVITRTNEGPCEIKLNSPGDEQTEPRRRASAPQQPADLWGRKFTSSAVTQAGEPRPLVPGTRITLGSYRSQNRRSVGWNAGCNGAGAKVRITAQELHLGQISSTLIGCPADRVSQDAWLSKFFSSNPRWRLSDSRLTLTSGGTVIELEETDR